MSALDDEPGGGGEAFVSALLWQACGQLHNGEAVAIPKFVPVYETAIRWLAGRGRMRALEDDFTGSVVAGVWLEGEAPWEWEPRWGHE